MHDELMPLVVKSPAFHDGDAIPVRYTGDGEDTSPPLTWSGVPPTAQSVIILCEDPDAPSGLFVHWVLYDLPATTREISAGQPRQPSLPHGARQGINDFGNPGYGGPAPPPGKPHRYIFRVLAVDHLLPIEPEEATRERVLEAVRGRIVAEGQLLGLYGR